MKEAERIRDLIRNQRHDWMNHIQVIMGYQMLKQSKKIDQYLRKLIRMANEERMISDLAYPPLATILLTINYDYAHWNWRIRRDDSIDSLSVKQQKQLYQILEQLLPWMKQRITPQTVWTDIEFDLSYKKNNLFFSFCFIAYQPNQYENDHKVAVPIDWGLLPKKIHQQKAAYEWLKEENRLLMKIPIR